VVARGCRREAHVQQASDSSIFGAGDGDGARYDRGDSNGQ